MPSMKPEREHNNMDPATSAGVGGVKIVPVQRRKYFDHGQSRCDLPARVVDAKNRSWLPGNLDRAEAETP